MKLSTLSRKLRTLIFIRLPLLFKHLRVQFISIYFSFCYLPGYARNFKSCDPQAVGNKLLEFVTLGKDEFLDLYPIYSHLININLPPAFGHTYVSDLRNQVCPSAVVINKPFRWTILELLDKHIYSKYVVLLHLDYFLIGPIDVDILDNACNLLNQDDEIDFIQLASNCGEKRLHPYNSQYDYFDESSDLFFNMQVRIWRRSSLFQLFINTPFNDISDERNYSRTCRKLGFKGLIHNFPSPSASTCINNPIYPYIATALNSRKWRASFSNILRPLLESHDIDPTYRGWIHDSN